MNNNINNSINDKIKEFYRMQDYLTQLIRQTRFRKSTPYKTPLSMVGLDIQANQNKRKLNRDLFDLNTLQKYLNSCIALLNKQKNNLDYTLEMFKNTSEFNSFQMYYLQHITLLKNKRIISPF